MTIYKLPFVVFLIIVFLFPAEAGAVAQAKKVPQSPVNGVVANPPPLHSPDPGVVPNLGENIKSSGTPLVPTGKSDADLQPVEGQVIDLTGAALPSVQASPQTAPSTTSGFVVFGWVLVLLLLGGLCVGWWFISKKK